MAAVGCGVSGSLSLVVRSRPFLWEVQLGQGTIALRLCWHNYVVPRGADHPQQPQLGQLQLTALSTTSLGRSQSGGGAGADGGILVFQWLLQGPDCK